MSTIQEKKADVKKKVQLSRSDKIYYAIVYALIIVLTLAVLYPLVYVVSASFSSGRAVSSGKVVLFPVEPSIYGYQRVLEYTSIWIGYRNTIFYTVVGTIINIVVTLMCAYALSRKGLRGRGFFTFMFTFTMIFSGGMIPSYILMRNLKILNTVWAMLLPGALSVYNMVVTRTFLQSNIPDDLLEAAKIDGCSDIQFFFKIVLPLSKAIIAVISLYYAVGHWNAYFNAFLYLNDKKLYPLQIFLRQVLVLGDVDTEMVDEEILLQMQNLRDVLKYAIIVVSTAPLMCAYPFVQKYFVKGVMIGSLKG
ncbi:MAG: carbohydrate ABC transporter permease [Clostridiales bacterium]|nr:carbohydrate ABC transporter permease [Clostridiales bacterium]